MEWPFIALLWVLSLVLGYIGFSRYSVAINEEGTALDILYRTLQLYFFESGDVGGLVPLQLEVARFLMPIMTIYIAIKAILAIFREQWQLIKVSLIKNHVVICGLSKRGIRLAQDFLEQGYQVVAIEIDVKNPFISQCRNQGAVVLIGDATNRILLLKAGVKKAKYLIIVCSDDNTNIPIALTARDLTRFRKEGVINVFVSIFDLELCNLLSGEELAASEAFKFRLEFFNIMERGIRIMLRDFSPFKYIVEKTDMQPHILLVGLNKMGRNMLIQLAINWWIKYPNNGKRLRISIIDKEAEAKVKLINLRYPQLEKSCELRTWEIDNNSPEFEKGDFLFDSGRCCDIDIVYIFHNDDIAGMVSALIIHGKTKQHKVPIILKMQQDTGLSTLFNENNSTIDFSQIHVFSLLDKTCSIKSLLGGMHEIIAQAIHEDYVNHQKIEGSTAQTNPSMVDWDCLPEDLKESNRYLADHIILKLNAINCSLNTLTNWKNISFKFLNKETELLSKMEHERWCEERKYQGWSYSFGPKDIKNKTSPYLVSWEELPEEIKEYDRNVIKGIPTFLARTGFQIYRRLPAKKL